MTKKAALAIAYFITLMTLGTGVAFADAENCKPIYGGGETCIQAKDFSIDKRVQNPQNQQFTDNLGVNDPRYTPGSTINFAITLTNTSKNAISDVAITDTFPKFVTFASGQGKYDKDKRTLTFSIAKLNANESKTYIVKGKVVDANKLPSGQGTSCMANLAQAKVKNTLAADNTQFCVQKTTAEQKPTPTPITSEPTKAVPQKSQTKGVQPTTKGGMPIMESPKSTTTPATGPEMLSLIALIPAGAAGLFLRKSRLGK